MQAYECDPSFQICSGGFGGGGPAGFAYAVEGVPYFAGITLQDSPRFLEPDGEVTAAGPIRGPSIQPVVVGAADVGRPQPAAPVHAAQQPAAASAESSRSWIGPVLLVIAAIAFLK